MTDYGTTAPPDDGVTVRRKKTRGLKRRGKSNHTEDRIDKTDPLFQHRRAPDVWHAIPIVGLRMCGLGKRSKRDCYERTGATAQLSRRKADDPRARHGSLSSSVLPRSAQCRFCRIASATEGVGRGDGRAQTLGTDLGGWMGTSMSSPFSSRSVRTSTLPSPENRNTVNAGP